MSFPNYKLPWFFLELELDPLVNCWGHLEPVLWTLLYIDLLHFLLISYCLFHIRLDLVEPVIVYSLNPTLYWAVTLLLISYCLFHIRLNLVEHVIVYSSLLSQLLHRSRRCLWYCRFSCAPPNIVSISSILDYIVIPWWILHSWIVSWNVSFPAIVVLRLSILPTPDCQSKVVNCTDTWHI